MADYPRKLAKKVRGNHTGAAISGMMLLLFCGLAVLVTFPVASELGHFTVLSRYSDSLLQAWTLAWDVHAILGGWQAALNLWNANIFFPYPQTLAFSEHLLPSAFLLMPVTLLAETPLTALNVGILLSTALSGWGTYLLVTWLTGNRWAGLVAGLFFAISPFRMGHLVHFNLLTTQWLPLMFFAAARLVRLNMASDLLLIIIFTNLQFFSVINYAPMIAFSLAVWMAFLLMFYWRRISRSLVLRLGIFCGVTLALNWPMLQLYRQMGERMGIVRTLGDARALSASLENYLKPMANSLLYARWLNLPTLLETAFPGLVVVVLVVTAVILLRPKRDKFLLGVIITLFIIIGSGFLLSFGPNDEAFGARFASITAKLLPYSYLYEVVPLFKGFRVPMRFALLVTFGLAVVAGIGFALVSRRLRWGNAVLGTAVAVLIIVEHLPAPVPGETAPFGGPVYAWLADQPAGLAVIEVPFYLHTPESNIELARVYQSAGHWQRLVNGGSGFKPIWMVELARLFDTFPDWRSFDTSRQLGIEYVVLHKDEYTPDAWANITALLPAYLPAIDAIHSVGNDLILKLTPANCTDAGVRVDGTEFPSLAFSNPSPATWVTDPSRVSRFETPAEAAEFLEPLFVPPGQTVTTELPVSASDPPTSWQVELANLEEVLTSQAVSSDEAPLAVDQWQSLDVLFVNGAIFRAFSIDQNPRLCDVLAVNLQWSFNTIGSEVIQVELVDRFGRSVASQKLVPSVTGENVQLSLRLPLAETLPAGLYQLQVQLRSATDEIIPAVGVEGVPVTEPLKLALTIRPAPIKGSNPSTDPVPLANKIAFLGTDNVPAHSAPGDWMRFSLLWQTTETIPADLTVFTQLIGPDGRVWAQHDNPPRGGWYPTTLWQPGEVVVDDYALRLDPEAPDGRYRLIAGMYDPSTGERVPTTAGSDFIEAGTVMVP